MTEEALFEEALSRSPEERAAFLEQACAGRPDLRAAVEARLAAHIPEGTVGMAERITVPHVPASGAPAFTLSASSETSGTFIGPYKLLQEIGVGGMGTVWKAEQRQPVRRTVALKLIKAGMDSAEIVARFDVERQALALMDHPNIARVFDAGTAPNGRPYFVMELVEGLPLTKFCDERRMGVRERLELFHDVCRAVQHAHQKGIIHRDLKPSNILVMVIDDKPVPKVIDFGVAKAVGGKLTEAALSTQFGAVVGTLEYMSPEQAGSGGQDIDTRADIYSLGVILYELLTGLRPLDARKLRQAALFDMIRVILEEEPSRPSTRLSTADALPSLAALRQTEPKRLVNLLRGELDWVVMKCLEKPRERRYETANGLARDIQRYLANEPVEARPTSAGYRLKKYVSRNKGVVIAASTVATALVLGLIGTLWEAHVARAEASRADERAAAADVAAHAEKARAAELQQVAVFQAEMLQKIDPTVAGEHLFRDIRARHTATLAKSKAPEAKRAARIQTLEEELRVVNATDIAVTMIDRTILKPAIEAIQTKFKDQPLVDASLRSTLGQVYDQLGRYDEMYALHSQSLAIRRRTLGDEHGDTLRSVIDVTSALVYQAKLADAERYAQEAYEKSNRVFGEDHRLTIDALGQLAQAFNSPGKFDKAETYAREAFERSRRVNGEDDKVTLEYQGNLGSILNRSGRLVEAEPIFRDVLSRRRRVLGEDHQLTLAAINELGVNLSFQGKHAEAEQYKRELLERHRRLYGADHFNTIVYMNNLATTLNKQHKYADAESLYREALEKGRRVLGADHPTTFRFATALAFVLLKQGKAAEAEPFAREGLDGLVRLEGAGSAQTANSRSVLGGVLAQLRRFSEAERDLLDAERVLALAKGAAVREALKECLASLGLLYGDWAKAEPGKGYETKAAEWKKKLDAINQPATPKGPK
jgi:serine/threonine protein kinase/tetratricopeptide (TPR) repeat protein